MSERSDTGKVSLTVSDADSGWRYVEASYEFGRRRSGQPTDTPTLSGTTAAAGEPVVLVTGATGGIGQALLRRLGPPALGASRRSTDGLLVVPDLECIAGSVGERRVRAVVHCAWPAPDNTWLTKLDQPREAVEHHVAQPLRQMIRLAQLLQARGTPDALLVLVGSAQAGRHNFRTPLYTMAKSLVPVLCRILAVELGASGHRCVAVVFDVIDGGMNKTMSAATRLAHEDRTPTGRIPTPAEVADQLAWVIENQSVLLSGATVTLSGGALP